MFRPCIDLHEGKVKQIVGSTLRDGGAASPLITNFESERPSRWYAELYKKDGLRGGHVIMLGPGNEAAAHEALAAWPGKVLWINFPSSVHLSDVETIKETAREIVALARESGRVILGITEDIPEDRWQQNLLAISDVIKNG